MPNQDNQNQADSSTSATLQQECNSSQDCSGARDSLPRTDTTPQDPIVRQNASQEGLGPDQDVIPPDQVTALMQAPSGGPPWGKQVPPFRPAESIPIADLIAVPEGRS